MEVERYLSAPISKGHDDDAQATNILDMLFLAFSECALSGAVLFFALGGARFVSGTLALGALLAGL